ncbi:FTR1 family protein [Domibacillus sp. DTU_2020_1001157_1_SI_ALB_TIR_016]|uniref:FTR1 family iron permease n=1 Tax=Domibacillus sp. DTU_2020_1001157_1_SI_ALB_TIR_016 TaxID=3077789 RepID=UPI0028EEE29C|nr:FTR1 family protein [Domibacillus sp. DTU_2020_1001157_1_SI_ALB_TIR_016]WNS82291.1 FTR1 family protein [Domibacillus sp. DTU_2020_1001157_1_SI_ALB_TIR_016]
MKRFFLKVAAVFVIICGTGIQSASAATDTDALFVPVGDAMMDAKRGDFAGVVDNMAAFQTEWDKLGVKSDEVDSAFSSAQKAAQHKHQEDVQASLKQLSSALVRVDEQLNPVDQDAERKKVAALLPVLAEMKKSEVTEVSYRSFESEWNAVEKIVNAESTAAYGDIETNMALLRISVVKEPSDPAEIKRAVGTLEEAINRYLNGTEQGAAKKADLTEYAALLKQAESEAGGGQSSAAAATLTAAISMWPSVEGAVQVKDASLYSDIEVKIPEAAGLLSSQNPDNERAAEMIAGIEARLAPLADASSYTWWDAALVLLREGLEAVLILSALLAFLSKTGQERAKKWIWLGAGGGILASVAAAVLLSQVFTGLAGAAGREYMEGLTGIAAVVMMIGVGTWLHGKSNIAKWNAFVKQSVGKAAASGSILSFAFISFLSVFREGAETIIFYAGMAPDMSAGALAAGIALAFFIVSAVGLIVIKYSVRVPMRLFFTGAALLIYVLAFKILGKSIHSLQVAGVIDTHTASAVPFIDVIGLYPTLETMLPQIILLIIIVILALWFKKQESAA